MPGHPVSIIGAYHLYAADHTLLNKLSCALHCGEEAAPHCLHEEYAAFPRRSDHLLHLRRIDGKRFLTHDRLAAFQRKDRILTVQLIRCCDKHGVYVRVSQKRLIGVICASCADLFAKLRSLSGRAGCGSVYFRVIDLCNSGRNAAGMPPAAKDPPIGISASFVPLTL